MELCPPRFHYLVCTQLQITQCPHDIMEYGINLMDEHVQLPRLFHDRSNPYSKNNLWR